MKFSCVIVEHAGSIATVTINRPAVMNAIDATVVLELDHALTSLAADPAVRTIIITGAGSKAFIAGADIRQFEHLDAVSGSGRTTRV